MLHLSALRSLLLCALFLLPFGYSSAQPFAQLRKPEGSARYVFERTTTASSADAAVLRQRVLAWMETDLRSGAADTATLTGADTIRASGRFRLPDADGLREVEATFLMKVMPAPTGLYIRAEDFRFFAADAATGEIYSIRAEEATRYFEDNDLRALRRAFDNRFATAVARFDGLVR